MSNLPYWFNDYIQIGQLKSVLRKDGVTRVGLVLNDAEVQVEVPDDPAYAAELGQELERLGQVLQVPPPKGYQLGLAHAEKKTKSKSAEDRTGNLFAPPWVRQQLKEWEIPKLHAGKWFGVAEGSGRERPLRGELQAVDFPPDTAKEQAAKGEKIYREIGEPWRWYVAKDPNKEDTIRELPELAGSFVPGAPPPDRKSAAAADDTRAPDPEPAPAEPAAAAKDTEIPPPKAGRRGRPKGSKNKPKEKSSHAPAET